MEESTVSFYSTVLGIAILKLLIVSCIIPINRFLGQDNSEVFILKAEYSLNTSTFIIHVLLILHHIIYITCIAKFTFST